VTPGRSRDERCATPRAVRRLSRAWLLTLLFAGAGCTGTDSASDARSGAPSDRTGSSGEVGTEQGAGTISVRDAADRTVTLDGPARRIVSLVPSVTLTLRELGATELLVGRTDYDKGEWIASLPSVGGGLEPNLESIVALRPDLVIRFAGNQDRRTPARLDDLGITHLAVRPDRVEDVLATVALVGRVTGLDHESDALLGRMREALATVEATVRDLPRRKVAYVLGGTPPWVAGPGTYIHELVQLAGGDNVFGDLGQLYAPVSPEEIRSRPIEVVLVSGVDGFDRALAPRARIQEVDANLEVPGPDLPASALRLAELIHGRTFPPLAGFETP